MATFQVILSHPKSGISNLTTDRLLLASPFDFTVAALHRHLVGLYPPQHRAHVCLRDMRMAPLNIPGQSVLEVYAGQVLVRPTTKLWVPRRRRTQIRPSREAGEKQVATSNRATPVVEVTRYVVAWIPFKGRTSETLYKISFVPCIESEAASPMSSMGGSVVLGPSPCASASTSTTSLNSLDDPVHAESLSSREVGLYTREVERSSQEDEKCTVIANENVEQINVTRPRARATKVKKTCGPRIVELNLLWESVESDDEDDSQSHLRGLGKCNGIISSVRDGLATSVNPWGLNRDQVKMLMRPTTRWHEDNQPLRVTLGGDAVRRVCYRYLNHPDPRYFVYPKPRHSKHQAKPITPVTSPPLGICNEVVPLEQETKTITTSNATAKSNSPSIPAMSLTAGTKIRISNGEDDVGSIRLKTKPKSSSYSLDHALNCAISKSKWY